MKLSTLFMIAIAIQLVLVIFDTGNAHQDTAIFQFVSSPQDWSSSTFLLLFAVSIGGLAAGAAIGSFFFKPDIVVFAVMVGSFISWMIPISSLWLMINSQALFGDANWVVATMTTAPLTIMGIMTIIGWWRNASGD